MKTEVEAKDSNMSNASAEVKDHDLEVTNAKGGVVEDFMAKGYVDPTVQLDEKENARLVKKIHWQ